MKKKMRNVFTLTRKSNGGFTLVELIVVIAILAILGGVAVPAYSGYVKKAERAGDEELLATVNTAFASACAMNGTDVYLVNGAYIGLNDNKTVDLTSVKPYGTDFGTFYAGNEASAFKVYAGLYFNLAEHRFMEGSAAYMAALETILDTMGDQIDMVKASTYAAMGADALMGAVDDVTDFAALMVSGESGKIFEMVNTPEYLANLASMMGMTEAEFEAYYAEMTGYDAETDTYANPRGFDQILANSTVLSVAKTVSSDSYAATKTDLINKLSSGKLADVIGTITNDQNTSEESLAAAALIYGLYTAHDPEGANNIIVSGNFSEIPQDPNSGFMKYLGELNDTNSQAYKDMEGYFASLEVVNKAVTDDPEVANNVLTNGYADPELVGILGGIIGG